jgi:hypothetical protein
VCISRGMSGGTRASRGWAVSLRYSQMPLACPLVELSRDVTWRDPAIPTRVIVRRPACLPLVRRFFTGLCRDLVSRTYPAGPCSWMAGGPFHRRRCGPMRADVQF